MSNAGVTAADSVVDEQPANILLIGPRGSGKSTIGRILAQRLNRIFVDLDEKVLTMFSQQSVREVWAENGERAWRDAEVKALNSALKVNGQIMALGGGVPVIPQAQSLIKGARESRNAAVVYLYAKPEVLVKRIRNNCNDRPSLTGADPISEIPDVLAQRDPVYRSLADFVMDNSNESIDSIAAKILKLLCPAS